MVDLETEIEMLRRKCINCGKCTAVCPSLKHGGVDPKEIMVSGEGDVTLCLECGNCSSVCRRTDPFRVMRDLRALVMDKHPPDLFFSEGTVLPRMQDPIDPAWDGNDVKVLPGCVVQGRLPYLKYAIRKTCSVFGLTSSEVENWTCCLRPASFSEMGEFGRRPYLSRMSASAKGSRLISLCGGCVEEMSRSGAEIGNIIPFVHEFVEKLPVLEKPLKVAMEPGCTGERYRKQMKEILTRMGCEIVNRTDGCCGNRTVPMMDDREAECKGAEAVIVACPNCQKRYDSYEGGIPVMHLTELICYAAGDASTLAFHNIKVNL